MTHYMTYLFASAITLVAQVSAGIDGILELGLPVIDIVTVDGQEPVCDYISHPEGSWGESITNAVKVPGSVTVYNPDGTVVYASGDYEKSVAGMTIKVRGNTSAYKEKKPFKIKLQKKGDLLARGDGYNDKDWVLIHDPMMKGWMGFEVSKAVGQPWTPACRYVNVVLNGDYRGMYLLVEAVERNTDCRIDVSKSGFIAEHDVYWWNEDGEYLPSADSPRYNYTLKYPDFEDVGTGRLDMIAADLTRFEKSVRDGSYPDVIDVDSFALWLIGHDLMGTSDGGGVNMFYTKYDSSPDTPLLTGPLWDFNSAEGTPGEWSSVHYGRFANLLSDGNGVFVNRYVELWREREAEIYSRIDASITSLSDGSWCGYNESVGADRERWGPDYHSYSTTSMASERMTEWYGARRDWMSVCMRNLGAGMPVAVETGSEWRHTLNGLRLTVESGGSAAVVYSISGTVIAEVRQGETHAIQLPSVGIYVISGGGKVCKINAR